MRRVPRRSYLVLGLDFGTSFTGKTVHALVSTCCESTLTRLRETGISYALSHTGDIYAVDEWPSKVMAKQVPSTIAYSPKSDDFSWGYQVPPDMEYRCAFIKPHLNKDHPPVPYVYDSKNMQTQIDSGHFRLPIRRIAQVVTLDYLVEVFKHARKFLQKQLDGPFLEITQIHFWITNRESLGDGARFVTAQLAREAARAAGFIGNGLEENLFGAVGESEAAVKTTLLGSSDESWTPGRNILVCNCGAGQVDITVYRLDAVDPQLRLTKKTSLKLGPEHGAARIDLNLRGFMERKFKRHFTSLPAEQKDPGSQFMVDFEYNKRKFDTPTTNRRQTLVPLTIDMKKGNSKSYQSGLVLVTETHMQEFFEPVDKIIRAISGQVTACEQLASEKITDIVLVGGLGDSPYLRSKLRDWWRHGHQSIELRLPRDSWGAIATGAVAIGLERAINNQRLMHAH